ncbi:MAG: DUF2190 family protein [Pseudomonadaceae bacterium]|nr:DUF2190 family protein [Pseudomonadaceae bacterium]
MSSSFVREGKTLVYTNGGSAIVGGSVVIVGDLVAVAGEDIANGATGVLYLEGEFLLPKVSGAEIGIGEKVIWDDSADAFEDSAATPASGDVSGAAFATQTAGSGTTTVNVKLANPGSVTA